MEIPAKIQIKHLGNLERIHRQISNSSTKQMCAGLDLRAPGVGKIHFAAKCW